MRIRSRTVCFVALALAFVVVAASAQEGQQQAPPATQQAEQPRAAEQPIQQIATPTTDDGTGYYFLQLLNPQNATQTSAGQDRFSNTLQVADLALALQNRLIADNPLGIEVAPVEEPLRVHLKLPPAEGVIVISAPPESEGAKAGLQQHDLILRVVEQPVGDAAAFIQTLKAGGEKPIRLKIVRAGKPLEIEAVPKQPRVVTVDFPHWQVANLKQVNDDRYRIGVTLADVDPTLRAHLKLPEGEGLVVTEVIPNSAAAEGGIQANDILTSLDGQPLTTIDKINEQVQAIKDRKVTLKFLRAGEEKSIEMAPRKNTVQTNVEAPLAAWIQANNAGQWLNCQGCHQNAHQSVHHRWYYQLAPQQQHLSLRLPQFPLGNREWTDLRQYFSLRLPQAAPGEAGGAGEQLTKLKSQLAEVQATIAALEGSLGSQQQQQQQNAETPKE